MSDFTLTIIDTTRIQNYIFGSNRLREHIGASHLIHQATHDWVQECLPSPHNLNEQGEPVETLLEENEAQQSELIYRGGGNVVLLFRSSEQARQTIRQLSEKILTHAPGLEIAVAHKEFDWNSEPLGGNNGIYDTLLKELKHQKQRHIPSTPLLGISVTLPCQSTGLPAVDFDRGGDIQTKNRPVSADVWAKIQNTTLDAADDRLRAYLPEIQKQGYEISRDVDDLGRSFGTSSYMAIVHADGNSMGKRFERIVTSYPNIHDNRTFLHALRDLSTAVEKAGKDALVATVQHMLDTFAHPDPNMVSEGLRFLLEGLAQNRTKGTVYLPIRPLVFGGDDVTFVCEGRLGLELARIYLTEFERTACKLPDKMGTTSPGTASAGVAIVKTHYPFFRAYRLCVELCTSAKQASREQKRNDTPMSAMDWYFATGGVTGTLTEMRELEYHIEIEKDNGLLHMRPVLLKQPGIDGWRSWETFARLVTTFLEDEDENWTDRRNKVISLREALRKGPEAVKQFRASYGMNPLPSLNSNTHDTEKTGWAGSRCGYFDAIEALDFYLRLYVTQHEEEQTCPTT